MTTEHTPITPRFTLLEELVARTRLSWLQMTVAVGLVLFLLLGGAAYLNGVLGRAATLGGEKIRPHTEKAPERFLRRADNRLPATVEGGVEHHGHSREALEFGNKPVKRR